MSENRRAPRLRTFKGGSITLPTGVVECVIRNVSNIGALLELKDLALVPDDFDLVIKPDFTRRQCHVVRRDAVRLGIQFV